MLETVGSLAACDVQGARWVNVLLTNVKSAISVSYHAIRQSKFARFYLAETACRLQPL